MPMTRKKFAEIVARDTSLLDKKSVELAKLFEVSPRTIRNYRKYIAENGLKGCSKIKTIAPTAVTKANRLEDIIVKTAEDLADDLLNFEFDEGPPEEMSEEASKKYKAIWRSFNNACKREDRTPEMVLRLVRV